MDTLLFELAGQRYGIPADRVREVVRMVAVTSLPRAPRAIEGVVNVRGEIVPVYDLRDRFELPPRRPDPAEHLIILNAGGRSVAIRVDAAESLETLSEADLVPADAIAETAGGTDTARHLSGLAKTADGVVVIVDLDEFLTIEESATLDSALHASIG